MNGFTDSVSELVDQLIDGPAESLAEMNLPDSPCRFVIPGGLDVVSPTFHRFTRLSPRFFGSRALCTSFQNSSSGIPVPASIRWRAACRIA